MGLKLKDRDPIIFDRRRFPGKECTGIVSTSTFTKLSLPREFVDREFKVIRVTDGRHDVVIETNVLRLNRQRVEVWLDRELRTRRPVDAVIKGEEEVLVGTERFTGKVFDASGWKGRAKWVKAVELVTEPLEQEEILVTLDSRNKAGFGWVVPLPDRALVGALSYGDPRPFIPRVGKRILKVHGGAIPRVKPIKTNVPSIGDRTGLIKTFTGGGLFSIAEILSDTPREKLEREIRRQYLITELLERSWRLVFLAFRFLDGKTVRVREEFDFHSLLFSLTKL